MKETPRDSDKDSAPAPAVSTTDEPKPADQAAPIPRATSISKPIPKPRPRSVVVEQDANKEPKVVETTEKPVAPPRAKAKPPRGDSEAGPQENSAVKLSKPEPPQRPDLNAPPPVKPKPKPVRSEEPSVSVNESNAVAMTSAPLSEDTVESNAQEIQIGHEKSGEGPSEVGPSMGEKGPKKAGPPPIPRRVDLE